MLTSALPDAAATARDGLAAGRLRLAAWCLTAAAIAATIFSEVHENTLQYYLFSGAEQDGYWLAGVIWRNSLQLENPPAFLDSANPSFYLTHFAPILQLGNLLSWLYPVNPAWNAASFIALIFVVVFVSAYVSALAAVRPRTMLGGIALGPLCALIAATGIMVVSLHLPHWEFLVPAFVTLTVLFVAIGRHAIAAGAMVLCLLSREDAGLHLAASLLPLITVDRLAGSWDSRHRAALVIVGAALVYSTAIMVGFRLFFEVDNLFQRSYAGTGAPYAHLSVDFLLERLQFYATRREYIIFPVLLLTAFAAVLWDRHLACGVIAFLPWLALNVTAAHHAAGTMAWYYGFPLITLLCWPFAALAWKRGGRDSAANPRSYVVMFAVLALASLSTSHPEVGVGRRSPLLAANQSNVSFHRGLEKQPTLAVAEAIRAALQDQDGARLGTIMVNGGLIGLLPEELSRAQLFTGIGVDRAYRRGDTVFLLGFSQECHWLDGFVQFNRLNRLFHFTGTNVFAVSRYDLMPIFGARVPLREIARLGDARGQSLFGCNKPAAWAPTNLLTLPQIPFP